MLLFVTSRVNGQILRKFDQSVGENREKGEQRESPGKIRRVGKYASMFARRRIETPEIPE